MAKARGRRHTSLTETAALVVSELEKIVGLKMIAPGEIRSNAKGSRGKFITVAYTNAGFELLISGQSVQKISIHTDVRPEKIIAQLKNSKKLSEFKFKERERKPEI